MTTTKNCRWETKKKNNSLCATRAVIPIFQWRSEQPGVACCLFCTHAGVCVCVCACRLSETGENSDDPGTLIDFRAHFRFVSGVLLCYIFPEVHGTWYTATVVGRGCAWTFLCIRLKVASTRWNGLPFCLYPVLFTRSLHRQQEGISTYSSLQPERTKRKCRAAPPPPPWVRFYLFKSSGPLIGQQAESIQLFHCFLKRRTEGSK